MRKLKDSSSGEDKAAGGKVETYDSLRQSGDGDNYTMAWEVERSVEHAGRSADVIKVKYEDLTDDQRVLFSGLVHGYSLADARWGTFSSVAGPWVELILISPQVPFPSTMCQM